MNVRQQLSAMCKNRALSDPSYPFEVASQYFFHPPPLQVFRTHPVYKIALLSVLPDAHNIVLQYLLPRFAEGQTCTLLLQRSSGLLQSGKVIVHKVFDSDNGYWYRVEHDVFVNPRDNPHVTVPESALVS
jgi:hypothetical protein